TSLTLSLAFAGVLALSACRAQAEPQVLQVQGAQPEIRVHWQPQSPAAGETTPPAEAASAPRLAQAGVVGTKPDAPAAAPKNEPTDRNVLEVPDNPDKQPPKPPAPVPPRPEATPTVAPEVT